ncbi:HU family DNA-binding protein [Nocardioides sp. HDW12B]|uniref:HU family DNA-binding protein n=1 Tax=Nocardioides sp. HDW12B TaxID=2714939 RepID=UPI00140E3284|nr:HU family DNA-binding protein [Nocardioides sp. HDW12B]QIK67305.1 HU family DNA-binding protein [Nocardioides sp. HDW12B]
MRKDELIKAIADSANLQNAEASRALDAVVEIISDGLSKGDKVQIAGLGTFEARPRNAREGRNPQTGETIQIAATTVPGFKAAKQLKDRVAG